MLSVVLLLLLITRFIVFAGQAFLIQSPFFAIAVTKIVSKRSPKSHYRYYQCRKLSNRLFHLITPFVIHPPGNESAHGGYKCTLTSTHKLRMPHLFRRALANSVRDCAN